MYIYCMKYEWNMVKDRTNKLKHGIDFETSKKIWLDENRIEIRALFPIENRRIIIGKIQDQLWTAIYTMREGAIRIISVRRSRKKEVELYEKEKAG